MKRVLVLGIPGMLGSMVYFYLYRNKSIEIAGSYQLSSETSYFEDKENIFILFI